MNSKKNKHKNRQNKPPNPVPPQTVEVAEVKADNVISEDVKQSLPKVEERVPEILSDVLTPVVDSESKSEEQPKKPKRNKGKKNSQEKVCPESLLDNPEPTLGCEESKNVKNIQELLSPVPEIAPCARKKKNKNKKTSEIESADNKNASIGLVEENKIEPVVSADIDIVASLGETPEETKQKKKNKKKKNRNDSEKSDKAELVSCTAAFQKLIKDEKADVKIANKSTVDEETATIIATKAKSVNESLSQELSAENITTISLKQSSDEIPGISGKGKKKNKKEKNNSHTEEDSKLDKNAKEMVTMDFKDDVQSQEKQVGSEIPQTSLKSDEVINTEPLKDVTKSNNSSEETKSSNAKIAKPGDKKRKEKLCDQKIEKHNLSQEKKIFETLEGTSRDNITDQHLKSASYPTRISDDKQCTPMVPELEQLITLVSSDTKIVESKSIVLDEAPDNKTGKKRTKSPKPMKSDQSHTKTDSRSRNENENLQETDSNVSPKQDSNDSNRDSKAETDIIKKHEGHQIIGECLVREQSKETVITADEKRKNLEIKSKKERKKSPRPANVKLKSDETTLLREKEDNNMKKDTSIKDTSQNQSITDDIEIRSLQADESEGSSCGLTPDLIQHPRATSQDRIDSNNNMTVIQEISAAEVTNLNIPFDLPDTPLIKGSGETPTVLPKLIVIDKGPIEVKYNPDNIHEIEKTDVKSKMMEVNRDMEDLRLSIEKSLAELTAIEKSEEKSENAYDTQKSPCSKETDDTLKMPSELSYQAELESGNKETPFQASSQNEPVLEENIKEVENEDAKNPMESSSPNQLIEDNKTPINITPTEEADNTFTRKNLESSSMTESKTLTEVTVEGGSPPICPTRKDQKDKGKNKKKGKNNHSSSTVPPETQSAAISTDIKVKENETKTKDKSNTSKSTQEKGKQQTLIPSDENNDTKSKDDSSQLPADFDPIENFEDAMTSSADDINRSFEIIASETNQSIESSHVNPEINITAPINDNKTTKKDDKINPVSQPKNLLGHPDIPVSSNRIDYKKEKNKTPNEITAKVKIKDAISIEAKRDSKESQTDNIKKFMKNKSIDEPFSVVTNENDDFVYKYSFRKVFLQSACHICKKELKQSRLPCTFCNLVFYCSAKHKDEDWSHHQAFCFAVSTIVHLKDQKHIYADAKDIKGQNYRLLRMQMIVSCEKVLKRRLAPWEQEALLYPRICAEPSCREWRQSKLADCDGCGQISFCAGNPDHIPKLHQRWCKSYSLYQKLVCYQQTKGRLEPKMPSKVMVNYQMPDKMNEVLASMYEEKIDMNDIQYAALTQIATAPLTAAFAYQTFTRQSSLPNGVFKKSSLTIHVVGAELQFEADALDKWEVFFLHAAPAGRLRLVLVAGDLNPSGLPLDLLANVKVCDDCRLNDRRVTFSFQDKMTYHEYCASDDFTPANLVCAFNSNISRSSAYNEMDPWPKTINCILKNRAPFLITASTINDIHRDFCRIKACAEHNYKVIIEPKPNGFASVRPDRNFLSDDETPLLFKNCCYTLIHGVP